MTPIQLAHDFSKQPACLTIAVQIKNIGFNKSNLTNWTFDFITEDNKKFNGCPVYSIKEQKINIIMNDNKKYLFPRLYESANTPLDQGKSIVGAIQFNINDLSLGMLNPKCIIILEAKDNKNRRVKFQIPLQTFFVPNNQLIAELHDVVNAELYHPVTTLG